MAKWQVANKIGIVSGYFDNESDAEELKNLLNRDYPEDDWKVYKIY